jgi:hypothetical protein
MREIAGIAAAPLSASGGNEAVVGFRVEGQDHSRCQARATRPVRILEDSAMTFVPSLRITNCTVGLAMAPGAICSIMLAALS